MIEPFKGMWDSEKPSVFQIYDGHTVPLGKKDMGGSVSIDIGAVSMRIVGGMRRFHLYITPPGFHSMFLAVKDKKIFFDESLMRLEKTVGKATKHLQAKEGVLYVFDKTNSLRTYLGEKFDTPEIKDHTIDEFWNLFLECAEEVYSLIGKPPVVTTISGGTDGILTAVALREIGAEQHCVCVGTNKSDFDPMHAARYAKQLKLPYTFLPLPTDTDSLSSLLVETLRCIEMADFSNVLMGMCNVVVREFALDNKIKYVFHADYADDLLGNDMLTVGRFWKDHPDGSPEDWAVYRMTSQMYMLPTSLQFTRAFRAGGEGVELRQIFYHPKLMHFLMSCDFSLTPASRDKVIYKAILDRYIEKGAWHLGGASKVGYYTGAGIGKIRLNNPVLQDDNIRAVFRKIRG